MLRLRLLLLGLFFVVGGLVCFYYSSMLNSFIPLVSTPLELPPFSLPPTEYQVMTIDDRVPSFRLAISNYGEKPYVAGDRAEATIVASLKLVDRCKQDPSLIVVDVGAYLGDFGLYAAACGCQVYMFEVLPEFTNLIRTSIAINNFSTTRVHILQRAVYDLPSNSRLTFTPEGGETRPSDGTLRVSTIRLDDVPWPAQSTIIMLKIDVEGFEFNVFRSAEKLIRENRIHHVIFEYTARWTDRSAQKDLLHYVGNFLGAKQLFALHRTDNIVYGPLNAKVLKNFHDYHVMRQLQTDIYARFVDVIDNSSLKVEPYFTGESLA